MVGSLRNLVLVSLLLFVVWNAGCTCVPGEVPETTTTTTTETTTTTDNEDRCGVDCSTFETAPCTQAVCNTGQVVGPLNVCVVVPMPTGTACDDGVFCTVNEVCDNGTCGGGDPNICGVQATPCVAVVCYEDTKTCDYQPVNDGAACTPTDLCEVNGVCALGECIGAEGLHVLLAERVQLGGVLFRLGQMRRLPRPAEGRHPVLPHRGSSAA